MTVEERLKKVIDLVKCPETGSDHYGAWGILTRTQRIFLDALARDTLDLIHRLQGENAGLKERGEIVINNLHETIDKQKAEIERLTEELKNLDWYKMWHKKFKKEIDDLTLELETYRPTKLSGNGQCKCSICGGVSWTDWFSRYKGKTLCDGCLKEIISTEEKQAVKDTAKEIIGDMFKEIEGYERIDRVLTRIAERYGVEVE